MQIHELTQPRKSQLDEIDMFGPGGLASEIGSAIRNPKQALGFTKDGKFSPGLAQQQADQSEYARRAAKAAGKIQSQLKPPTLDQSLDKLKANPGAQQWINGITAQWPAAAEQLGAGSGAIGQMANQLGATNASSSGGQTQSTPSGVMHTASATNLNQPPAPKSSNAPVSLGGKKLDPNNPSDAQVLAAIAKKGIKEAVTPPASNQDYAAGFRRWVDSQLKTTKLATLESDPEVKAKLEPLLQQIVAAKGNESVQQKLVHTFFSYAVAANHVIQAKTQGQSPEQRQPLGQQQFQSNVASGQEIAPNQQAVDTGLNQGQLLTLSQKANAAGGPRPKSTGNPFYDSLIAQIRGGR